MLLEIKEGKSNMEEKQEIIESNSKEIEEGKAFAFLGVFFTVLGFAIVLIAKKDNNYAMYYAKQGLVIGIGFFALSMIMIIPVIGWITGAVGYILLSVLWIIGWIKALSGKMTPIPLIGLYADKFKI